MAQAGYEFQEYPKWVKGQIVETAEEEAAMLGEDKQEEAKKKGK